MVRVTCRFCRFVFEVQDRLVNGPYRCPSCCRVTIPRTTDDTLCLVLAVLFLIGVTILLIVLKVGPPGDPRLSWWWYD